MTQQTSADAPPEIDGGAVRLTKQAPPEAETRVVLFYIGDQAYTVPKALPASAALDMLRVYRRSGLTAAQVWMFEQLVGDDGLKALSGCAGMTTADLKALMDKTTKLYAGELDELLGN